MLTRFTTLALGDTTIYAARATYALLAVLAHLPDGADVELTVVTDHPQRFRWLGDRVRPLVVDAATIERWKGPHRYFFRCEIEALRLLAAQGPGNLVYLDSDILVRQDLAPFLAGLEAGDLFMHLKERSLASSRRDRALWASLKGRSVAGIPVDAQGTLWNAGVMALPASAHALADQVAAFNDGLMDQGVTHWLVEQVAFSQVFLTSGRLQAADRWMDHWWGNKPGHDAAICEFLLEARLQGWSPQQAAEEIRRHPLRLPMMVRRRWHHRLFKSEPRYRPE